MRILVAAVLVIVIFVLAVMLSNTRNQVTAVQGQLATATAELGSTRQALQTTQATLKTVQAERDELASRGNVIMSMALRVELACTVRSQSQTIPKIVTLITLARPDGTSIRLVDDSLAPDGVRVDADHATLTLEYRPLHGADVVGHQLDDLRSVSTLGVRYDDVLHALGLELQDVSRVVLTINEVPTLQLEHLGVPTRSEGSDFATLDVSRGFAGITAAYTAAVRMRMNAR